jgi:putative oxidoreductase
MLLPHLFQQLQPPEFGSSPPHRRGASTSNLKRKEPIMIDSKYAPYAAFLLRAALGVMFIAHGLLKVFVFTLPGTAQFFASVGFPGWTAYPVALAEVVGGVLLVSGIYTRVVATALIPVLAGAAMVHLGNGWVFSSANGGWEYPVFLIVIAAVVALLGDGAFALRPATEARERDNRFAHAA